MNNSVKKVQEAQEVWNSMNLLFVYDYHDLSQDHSLNFNIRELNLEGYDFWFLDDDCSMYPFLMWQGRRPSKKKILEFLNQPKTIKFLREHGFVSGKEYDAVADQLENNNA